MTTRTLRYPNFGLILLLALCSLVSPALAQKGKGGGGGGGGNTLPANPNIAYTDMTGFGLQLMDTSTGKVGELSQDGVFPAWSPDGSQIAFRRDSGNQDLVIMDTDGSGSEQVLTAVSGQYGGGLDWSRTPTPNGRHMLIYSEWQDLTSNRTIYALELDGSDKIPLLSDPTVFAEPRWSPLGDHFLCRRTDPVVGGQLAIFTVGLDTNGDLVVVGTPTPITNVPAFPRSADFSCDWSNDGQSIVVSADNDLWIIDAADPTISYQLTFTPNEIETDPTFDATDSRIYFTSWGTHRRLYSIDALVGGAPVLESGKIKGIWGPQCRRN